MSELVFMVNPKALANVLNNVLVTIKEKPGIPVPRQVLLRYQFDETTGKGQIMAIGCGRYAAGLDWCEVEGGTEGYAEVVVVSTNLNKTDVVDDLSKLESLVRKTSAAKNAVVKVSIIDQWSITVEYGPELLGELADQGNQHRKLYEQVEDRVDGLVGGPAHPSPTAFNVEVLSRLKDIKVTGMSMDWGIIDMARHPTEDYAGFKVGPTYRGLFGAIDRAGYAAGGPWGDGAGTQDHLF